MCCRTTVGSCPGRCTTGIVGSVTLWYCRFAVKLREENAELRVCSDKYQTMYGEYMEMRAERARLEGKVIGTLTWLADDG